MKIKIFQYLFRGNRSENILEDSGGVAYPSQQSGPLSDDESRFYERILAHMEERKPFLDGDFTLEDLSRRIYSNRGKISRAINNCSGLNFKQFVNWYRVRHATQMIRKDPRMRLNEVAKYSGFNTQPSFNLAFKFFMKETPSEYARHIHRRQPTLPSSPQAGEQSAPSPPSSPGERS